MDDALYPLIFCSVALTLLATGAIVLFLRRRLRDIGLRLAEFERTRRRQYGELAEDLERSEERQQRDLQSAIRLMSLSGRQHEERLEALNGTLTHSLEQIAQQMAQTREFTAQSLQQIRKAVDEELENALGSRLDQSFRQVSQQLERVYKGLGEMQALAGSVGDLKRVLSGVKTRGVWGEIRLETLLRETLTADQYLVNTPVVAGATERVEYAIRLPGKQKDQPVLLPIDAKFPQEVYQRLVDAEESGEKKAIAEAGQRFETAIGEQARRISEKYIHIPDTTDFAVMFLATESLYAEVLRRPGLSEKLQQKYRVLPAGPGTITALLSSLEMGFRTLAVEQRSEEIWRLLGSVREEFAGFGHAIERTRQRLNQAEAELDGAAVRTRQLTRQLGRVQQLDVPWRAPEDQ